MSNQRVTNGERPIPPAGTPHTTAIAADRDIELLLNGRLHDPRRVLGAHARGANDIRVRVLLPSARRVRLLEPAVELDRVPGTALFEWTGPKRLLKQPYRIRWETHDGAWHEGYDPYSFSPHIDAADLARFASGGHVHAHRFLGAHALTIDGVPGIRFAVWAPSSGRNSSHTPESPRTVIG